MSVVMAVKQGNRIWFGADTQSTRGTDRYNQLSHNDFKVTKLPNGVLLAMTGETATSQAILAHPEWFTVDAERGLTKEDIVTKIVPKMYEALDAGDFLECADRGTPPTMKCTILIAHQDKLFEIARDLQVMRYEDYQAIGSGSNAILYGLSRIDKSKDINEQLLRLLKIKTTIVGHLTELINTELHLHQVTAHQAIMQAFQVQTQAVTPFRQQPMRLILAIVWVMVTR
jgi:ATP-dependent protease HslVU (ClpYQ) peptidase subunit